MGQSLNVPEQIVKLIFLFMPNYTEISQVNHPAKFFPNGNGCTKKRFQILVKKVPSKFLILHMETIDNND